MYSINLTLKELGQYNKIFKMYETIEESYNSLEKLFLKEKVSIKYADNKFCFVLIMNSPLGDEEEIILPLEKKHIDKIQINDILINQTNQLKKRIKILEDENASFKNIIRNLESKILENDSFKDIIKNLETKILSLENKMKVLEKSEIIENKNKVIESPKTILDSKIIDKIEEIEFIIKRLKQGLNNENFKFNLLYRATKDGDALSTFHSKCDNKTNVLIFYYTIKGVKFGGYTEIGFDSSRIYKNDLKSFLFSIQKEKIYNSKNNSQLFCHEGNGPSFGKNRAIYLKDNIPILSKKNTRHETCDSTISFEGLDNYEINNGERYFNLQELEVFQLILS